MSAHERVKPPGNSDTGVCASINTRNTIDIKFPKEGGASTEAGSMSSGNTLGILTIHLLKDWRSS